MDEFPLSDGRGSAGTDAGGLSAQPAGASAALRARTGPVRAAARAEAEAPGAASVAPLAILGHACRLPGAPSAEAFWTLLSEGRSAIRPMGDARWSGARFLHPDPRCRGRTYTDAAGLVEGIWEFDAGFFGLSAREAEQMDPQQRLLLMTAWDAIEDAGIPPGRLSGGRTGVYVGCSASDHAHRFLEDPARIDSAFMTGNTLSIVANRLSHAFDLGGPSYTVDTACSSSLFALDQAARALAAGEVDLALVGGVHALLSPLPFVGFSRAGMLSPSGRVAAFDAGADGYVRGEGAVVVVLARLADAAAAGDRVRALLAATATNTTGRGDGLTRPSAARQAALMRAALRAAGAAPDDIAFVEAHGTGTPVGDPREAEAIGAALGAGAGRAGWLPIGSVKTNIGHLEPASGLAGLLKACLALERGRLPASLNFAAPNPAIPFGALGLRVAAEPVPLPAEGPRHAVVNSFGFGGANACAVLRGPEAAMPPEEEAAEHHALVLSAASAGALERQIAAWRDRFAVATPVEAAALTGAAAHRRARLAHRAVVLPAAGRSAAVRLAAGEGVIRGQVPGAGGCVAFAFAGNGSQYAGMGAALHAADPAYRAAFERVADLFAAIDPSQDPRHGLDATHPGDRLRDPARAQPALFALQVALVEALAARGLRAQAVIGHSVGEAAAAWAAGAVPLEEAVRLIATRAPLLSALPAGGGMAAVLAPAEETARLIATCGISGLHLSGDNSARSSTVSGSAEALAAFERMARARRVATRRLEVGCAFHSPALEPLRSPFHAALDGLAGRAAAIPFASSTAGGLVAGERLGLGFWWRNLREPVRFREAAEALLGTGAAVVVEIGPRPVLRSYLLDAGDAAGRPLAVLAGLDRGTSGDAWEIVARALAHGAPVDEARMFGAPAPYRGGLPPYPWETRVHRLPDRTGTDAGSEALLGAPVAGAAATWDRLVDADLLPWLADHRVEDRPVMPAAGFAAIALAAGRALHGEGELRDLDILAPLGVEPGESRILRCRVEAEAGVVLLESRTHPDGTDWVLHARGSLGPATRDPLPATLNPPPAGATDLPEARMAVPAAALYAGLAADGLAYGPAFRIVQEIRFAGAQGVARLDPDAPGPAGGIGALDAAIHALHPMIAAALPGERLDGDLLLPLRIGRYRRFGEAAATSAALTLRSVSRGAVEADLRLLDARGVPVAAVEALRLVRVARRSPRTRPGVWVERLIPIAPPALPPEPRLAVAALPEAGDGTQSDMALLLDALCRRAAWQALAGSRDSAGTPAAAAALRARLLQVLAEDGVDPSGDLPCPYPETADLVRALISRAPEAAGRLRQALWLSGALPARLAGRTPPGLPDPALAAVEGLAGALAAAVHAAVALIEAWPSGARLEVLAVGPRAEAMARALGCRAEITRLTAAGLASEPDTALAEAGRGTVAPAPRRLPLAAALGAGPYDLAVSCAGLAGLDAEGAARLLPALAPGGLLVATEPAICLLDDLVALAAGLPGSLPSADPAAALRLAGFRCVDGNGREGDADCPRIVVARAPRRRPEPVAPDAAQRSILVATAPSGAELPLAGALAGRLAAAGHRVVRPEPGLVPDALDDAILIQSAGVACAGALATSLDAIRALAGRSPARLWLVAERASAPAGRALSGLARTLANEQPQLSVRQVGLGDGLTCAGAAEALAVLVADPPAEPEIRLGPDGPAAPRLLPSPHPVDLAARPAGATARSLAIGRRGDLASLEWREATRRAPGPGEIELAVHASGLNFRDVLWAQGHLPEEALEAGHVGPTLGMDLAGIVARAGAGAPFAPGTRVMAIARQAFATHVTLDAGLAAPVPDGIDLAAAAGLPVAFLTAEHALGEVARLGAGESVLVHGGAGGVGLAALQVARALGARVFATAGSPDKRMLLATLGAEQVFDSRSLGFADAVRDATGGRGVDVVLNSLAGEAMRRSIGCLAPFGRFVELGKRDLFADTRIGLRPFRANLSYHAVDADQLLRHAPERAARLLSGLAGALASGRYGPLPVTVLEAPEAAAAMRLMARSAHVGRMAIRPPVPAVSVAVPATARAAPRLGQGAWLIAGGLGGFGLATARRLVAEGVRRVWLTGRSGRPAAADAAALAALRASGARVETVAADVADTEAMAGVFARIAAEGPLEGVLHAAMVLDDARLADLDAGRIAAVLRPKLDGALALDRLSRPFAPRHFVLYSSLAACIGNPGQAAYAAANAALEGLAEARRAEGLPALALAWGPIADAGYLDRETGLRGRLDGALGGGADGGMTSAAEALDLLAALLAVPDPPPVMRIGRLPWARLAAALPIVAGPIFERLDRGGGPRTGAVGLARRLAGLDPAEALLHLTGAVTEEVAAVLRTEPGEIERHRPLADLGLDSLMAVDLKLALEDRLGRALPPLPLGEGVSCADLARRILAGLGSAALAEQSGDEAMARLVAQHVGAATALPDAAFLARVIEGAERGAA